MLKQKRLSAWGLCLLAFTGIGACELTAELGKSESLLLEEPDFPVARQEFYLVYIGDNARISEQGGLHDQVLDEFRLSTVAIMIAHDDGYVVRAAPLGERIQLLFEKLNRHSSWRRERFLAAVAELDGEWTYYIMTKRSPRNWELSLCPTENVPSTKINPEVHKDLLDRAEEFIDCEEHIALPLNLQVIDQNTYDIFVNLFQAAQAEASKNEREKADLEDRLAELSADLEIADQAQTAATARINQIRQAKVELCNSSPVSKAMAIAYMDELSADWTSRGYFNVESGTCQDIITDIVKGADIFVHVHNSTRLEVADGVFCGLASVGFRIVGDRNCQHRGYQNLGYLKATIDPTKPAKIYINSTNQLTVRN